MSTLHWAEERTELADSKGHTAHLTRVKRGMCRFEAKRGGAQGTSELEKRSSSCTLVERPEGAFFFLFFFFFGLTFQ